MLIPKIVQDIGKSLQLVVDALQNRLTLGENLLCTVTSTQSPATPDEEFTIQHDMGRVPTQYLYNLDIAGIVYDSRRSSWTSSTMYLKCSVASANIQITIM